MDFFLAIITRSREIIRGAGKKAEASGRARMRKGTSMVSGGERAGLRCEEEEVSLRLISAESEAREAAVARQQQQQRST